MDPITGTFGTAYILFWAFVIVMIILWVLLPFAVFGIKDYLKSLLKNSDEMIKSVRDLNQSIAKLNAPKDPGKE